MILTVQMLSGSVKVDRMNGSNHSRYHGYTTGAQKSDAAIGQAKASEDPILDSTKNLLQAEPESLSGPKPCGFGTAGAGPVGHSECLLSRALLRNPFGTGP